MTIDKQKLRKDADTIFGNGPGLLMAIPAADVRGLLAEIERIELISRISCNHDGFKAVLDERDQLKAENERLLKLLGRMADQYVPLKELEGAPGYSRVVELVELAAERDQLQAKCDVLTAQVKTLQADPKSWQSGYDEGRRMGTKTAYSERHSLSAEIALLRAHVEPVTENTKNRRERWLRNIEDAKKHGLPGELGRRLSNTAKEIRASIRYGGNGRTRAELERLRAAAIEVLSWIEAGERPPVRDELEVGRLVGVRLHALADLHDAMNKGGDDA